MDKKTHIIAVVGPTASGKSDLTVKIALITGGEVISADSRQVYRGLDIGTGKVTKKEMRGVPHYMLDIASPIRTFTVSQYQKKSRLVLDDILKRKKVPIVCGGTGQYVDALLRDIKFPAVKPDMKLRARLEKIETHALFVMLKKMDPIRAKKIDSHNRRRLVRAIEIAKHIGASPTNIGSKLLYPTIFIGINPQQEVLYKRIHERLLKRIREGMVQEVEKLRAKGISWERLEKLGLEYRYVALYLQKKMSKKEMIEQLYSEIKKYSKRQMTWFKRNKDIYWVSNPSRADMRTILNKTQTSLYFRSEI